jgi:hypothetical protein
MFERNGKTNELRNVINIIKLGFIVYGLGKVLLYCGTVKKNFLAPLNILTDYGTTLNVVEKDGTRYPYIASIHGSSKDFVRQNTPLPVQPNGLGTNQIAVHIHRDHKYNQLFHGEVYTTTEGIEYIIVDRSQFE